MPTVEVGYSAPLSPRRRDGSHRQPEGAVDFAVRTDRMMEHVAVVGAGYMGGGIAQVFAMAGVDVVIVDADPALTARHLDRLGQEAEDFEDRGLFDPDQPS